ncbi:MAG: hypothetical protein WDO14_20210 [Bacteroidota bacterium]
MYACNFPADSLEYVQKVLATRSYLMGGGNAFLSAIDGSIWVNISFNSFDAASLNDWLQTSDDLQLSLKQNQAIASSVFKLKVIPVPRTTGSIN